MFIGQVHSDPVKRERRWSDRSQLLGAGLLSGPRPGPKVSIRILFQVSDARFPRGVRKRSKGD